MLPLAQWPAFQASSCTLSQTLSALPVVSFVLILSFVPHLGLQTLVCWPEPKP
jgi:hypothetical protein